MLKNTTPQVEKGKVNKCMMKSHKSACACPIFLSQPERTYWSLTPQLETAVIEVSTVQVLRPKANPQRLHEAKHLPSINWIYSHTGFYSGQASCLNMKVLTCAKDVIMHIFIKPLPTWVMIKMLTLRWLHKLYPDLQLCIKAKVGVQCKLYLFSYNFLIAGYQYSTPTLSYNSLGYISKVRR